jgi:gliding motility-associated-like protein
MGLIAIAISPISLFGSHLVGGKMTYRYLGSNNYEIKLTVYRDCSDQVDFDSPATISIYSKANNALVSNSALFLNSRSIVPANPPNPCFIPPPGICVEIGTYIDTVSLPNNGFGYTVSYQRCCHNNSVLNLVVPQMVGTTITTDIPPQINSSAQFLNFPPIFICQSDTFKYSFASTDADGDNLVYQFCTPLSGGSNFNSTPNPATPPPYLPVSWSNTFSATNPVPNNGGITLNSSTGQLKFKPSMSGQYAIGVCVLEYRNNVLINTNRLELQFNIVNCYLVSSIPTATNLCEGLTINFQNGSTNANAYSWNFGDQATLGDTSHLYTPTYTFPTYGTYTVSLVVQNTAYGSCKDTAKKVINVNPLLSPTLQPTYSGCFKNNNFNFNVGGSFHPSASFAWNFTGNSNSPNSSVNPATAHFTTASPKTVSVVINQFGCKDTLFATVSFTNPTPSINKNFIDCNGLTPFLGSTSTNASNVFWDFGDLSATNDTSSLISPAYSYPAYGIYTLTIIAYQGACSDTLRTPVNIQPKLVLFPDNYIQKQCFKNNSFSYNANGIYGTNAVFSWTFANSPNPIYSNIQNPSNINFLNAGVHTITVSLSENGCVRTSTRTTNVLSSPKANVILSDTTGCEPLLIKFKAVNDSLHPVSNYWNINNQTFSDTTIFYPFNISGSYSYSLVVKDTNNCSDTIRKINYIQIYPKPELKHFVTPLNTNILYPQITFIDSTQNQHTTFFDFGDGNTSTNAINNYNYQSEGNFPYTLIVTTPFGCTDTTTGVIIIDGIASNYVPNIFTPNNDGVNEHFFIKGKSIASSSMQIFNRWGKLVCDTSNALEGWNGLDRDSGDPVSAGTYFYLIKITLENKKSYSFNGTVQLQR